MTAPEMQVSALELFNEKARILLDLSFVKAILTPGSGVTIRGQRREDGAFDIDSALVGPASEAVQAFVLTFRYFVQDNESISLRRMAALYDVMVVDLEVKESFRIVRDSVNTMLDSANFVRVAYQDATPSNRDVMQTFIYGGLAHANPEKYQLFKEWMSFPPLAALMQGCFNLILVNVLEALIRISAINERAIRQLPGQNPSCP